MKKLIYQYWKGKRPDYTHASEEMFRKYAEQVNADYFLGDGRRINLKCLHKRYFAALMPLITDYFQDYDIILYVDMDVLPVPDLKKDIFALAEGHIMMCEEICQPSLRANMQGKINLKNDLKWADTVESIWGKRPFTDNSGRPRVFNSGVVLYTKAGTNFLKKKLPNILRYQIAMKFRRLPKFYSFDQNYLNSFINLDGIEFKILPEIWNSQVFRYLDKFANVHLLDRRTDNTCFIHVQPGPIKRKMSKTEIQSIASGHYPITEKIRY